MNRFHRVCLQTFACVSLVGPAVAQAQSAPPPATTQGTTTPVAPVSSAQPSAASTPASAPQTLPATTPPVTTSPANGQAPASGSAQAPNATPGTTGNAATAHPIVTRERQPIFSLGFSTMLKMPINLSTGALAPIGLGFAANLSFRVTNRTWWCADVSVGTPLNAFIPSPGMSTGPCVVVAPHVIINPNLMYTANMTFTDSAHSPNMTSSAWTVQHSVGANVAIGFPMRNGVILAFPIALSYNLNTDQLALIFLVKLGFAGGQW